MKTIHVVAAIIEKEDKILIAQRLKGEHQGLWEFPGGKVEDNETNEQALIREIKEEFETDIQINTYLSTIEYQYPHFNLVMDCYICTLISESMHLNDHSAIRWIYPQDANINWVPADVLVIETYKSSVITD
ncbi:MAG: (deoxy)nucleoside triphosphate pyrophosphohydrolase [Erysipelotrichaceae bacterium]|nr:(deoxy)nucleoside triphosphate pyrophosphohydrolase [Erysipelotrichaceae bacterium]